MSHGVHGNSPPLKPLSAGGSANRVTIGQSSCTSFLIHNSVKIMELNPYKPPKSSPKSSLEVSPRRRSVSVRSLLSLQIVVIMVSLALEAYEHETIVGTGAFFSLVGIAIASVAYRGKDYLAMTHGLSAIAFSCLIVFLINFNQWGPPQGNRPITILAFCYAVIALPLAGWLALRRSREKE